MAQEWIRSGWPEKSCRRNSDERWSVSRSKNHSIKTGNRSKQRGFTGDNAFQTTREGGSAEIREDSGVDKRVDPIIQQSHDSSEIIIEPKKRKTLESVGLGKPMGQNTNIVLDTNENIPMQTDQDISSSSDNVPKNGPEASIQEGARLSS